MGSRLWPRAGRRTGGPSPGCPAGASGRGPPGRWSKRGSSGLVNARHHLHGAAQARDGVLDLVGHAGGQPPSSARFSAWASSCSSRFELGHVLEHERRALRSPRGAAGSPCASRARPRIRSRPGRSVASKWRGPFGDPAEEGISRMSAGGRRSSMRRSQGLLLASTPKMALAPRFHEAIRPMAVDGDRGRPWRPAGWRGGTGCGRPPPA